MDGRRSHLRRLAMTAALFLLAGSTARAQTSRDVYFDWPVGSCHDSKLVLGYRYYVQRDFETVNDDISARCQASSDPNFLDYFCFHAGLDLSRLDNRENAIGEPVYAAADGQVIFSEMTQRQGRTMVVAHPLPGGTSLYSAYLHLNETAFVVTGEPVRRGQPLGTILSWPDIPSNSHTHWEIRTTSDGRVTTRLSNGNLGSDYFGNGYSLMFRDQVTEDGPSNLREWGFFDPADFMFLPERRPPFPARVLTQEAGGGYASYVCDARRQLRPAPTIPDPDTHTEPNANASEWRVATRIVPEEDSSSADADNLLRGWYSFQPPPPAAPQYLLGFEQIYTTDIIGAPLCVAEPYRVGRLWKPPAQDPLVDLRFGRSDWNGSDLDNWGTEGTRATVAGTLEEEILLPPYASLEGRDPEYCDLTAVLNGTTAWELALGPDADFRRGVVFEAMVRLESVDGTRFLAGRWEDGGEQWKLEVDRGDLVFTVRQAGGLDDLSLRYTLPAPRCKTDGSCSNVDCFDAASPRRDCVLDDGYRKWVHVGAVSDAFDRTTLELYWDGVRVQNRQQVATLAESTAPVRIGDSTNGILGRIDNVSVWEIDPRNRPLDLAFVVDTTGSMSDDIAAVKSAATQIVDALNEASADFRVAVTDFRDFPFAPFGSSIDYPYRVRTDFSTNRGTIVGGINSLNIGAGGDLPESVYSGVLGAILGRQGFGSLRLTGWRSNAQKIVILMGDAPPHDPEPVTGFDISDVLVAAASGGFEIGDPIPNAAFSGKGPLRQATAAATERIPVRIFSVLIGGNTQARNFFRQMAEGTDGELFAAATANQVVQAVLNAIGAINGGGGGGTPPVNQAPEVGFAYASQEQLWPPNHQMQPVTVEGIVDPEGDPVTVTITGITQDEPVSDKGRQHTPDGAGVGTSEARLRAERSPGSHDGRVYQITFTATDDQGASSTGLLRVCVPHDPSPNTVCIDDGQVYDSTLP